MRSPKMALSIILILILLLLFSCSNPKKDYEKIQKLQETAEQLIQTNKDPAAKIKSCDNILDALQEFLKKHPEGEWTNKAKTALASWQSQKAALEEEISRKSDYEEIQKLQEAAEKVLKQSPDYDVKIKSCDDIIKSLQGYLKKHPEGEWSNLAKTAIMAWQSRRVAIEKELNSLSDRLYARLREKAIEVAKKKHELSKIQEINLDHRAKKKEGGDVIVNDTYSIRMRGALLKTHIFKMKVSVSGRIATATKDVLVDEKASVEE